MRTAYASAISHLPQQSQAVGFNPLGLHNGVYVPAYPLKEEEQKALLAELENILKENQAEIENRQLFGRRQLADEINPAILAGRSYSHGLPTPVIPACG